MRTEQAVGCGYTMEELIPIVAKLADKYTSKESTSISYERAQQLMEAVIYCIEHCSGERKLISRDEERLAAATAYQRGYENLISKVKKTQESYNEMILHFHAYGNENYHDTVTKALPGFFRYYDVRFAPQESLITMDYPVLCPIIGKTGIGAIEKYVEYICLEQKFMGALPDEYVQQVLYRFQADYRKQFYNICNIVLRHILGHMMLGKGFEQAPMKSDYEMLSEIILKHDVEWIEEMLMKHLHSLIQEKYNGDEAMEKYLQADIKNAATDLYNAAHYQAIGKVIVL